MVTFLCTLANLVHVFRSRSMYLCTVKGHTILLTVENYFLIPLLSHIHFLLSLKADFPTLWIVLTRLFSGTQATYTPIN